MTEESKTKTEENKEETIDEKMFYEDESEQKKEDKVEEKKECEKVSSIKGNAFIKLLGVSIVDQIIAICASLVGFFLVNNVILRVAGYQIKSEYKVAMYLIIYIVVNVFYRSICETSKLKATVGKKVFK